MKSSRRAAAIDLGTNTFHLLVADIHNNSFEVIHNETKPVRIGAGGITEGFITPEAQIRALQTIRKFKTITDKLNVEIVEIYATSAFRSAENAGKFISGIKSETGLSPQIIDGKSEVEFIYGGVREALQMQDIIHLIIDIGGGSNEFIICDAKQIMWSESFEIGAQRLKDRFHNDEPISENDVERLYQFLDERLAPLSEALVRYQPEVLAGCAGTFDTLSDIFEIRNNIPSTKGKFEGNFDKSAFVPIFQELKSKTYEERMRIPGMTPLRAEMIVMATCLINWVLSKHLFKKMRISRYAMKEGILFNLMYRNTSL